MVSACPTEQCDNSVRYVQGVHIGPAGAHIDHVGSMFWVGVHGRMTLEEQRDCRDPLWGEVSTNDLDDARPT